MRLPEARKFVVEWQKADSIQDFCKIIGMDRRDASNIAASMRRHKVPLKSLKLRRGRPHEQRITDQEYRELAEIAKQMNDVSAAQAEGNAQRKKCSQFAS
jgi:hypothetical protein